MTHVGVFVPVSAVFSEVSNDFDTFCMLVRSLSRTDTLFWCARLNLILSNPESHDSHAAQQYAVTKFFEPREVECINKFALEHKGSKIIVFFRGQLLELMRWACVLAEDHPNDGSSFEDADVRRRFAQAALIASDIWARRVYRDRFTTTGDLLADRQRTMPITRQAVASNTSAVELSRVLGRGTSIYGDVFRHSYPNADAEFLASTSLTLEQYFVCVGAIMLHFIDIRPEKEHENPGIFGAQKIGQNLRPEMVPVVEKYLALESQTADDLRKALGKGGAKSAPPQETDPFGYLPLRERPILRTPDGRCIVLDPVFYSEKTSVGPLFALVRALRGKKQGNTAFGAFGAAFESYVHGLLRAMYPNHGGLLSSRLSCSLPGRRASGDEVEIADACLNDVSDVVLFEVKATFIRDDLARDDIEGTYLDALRAQYAAFDLPNERDKGAGQLARTIRDLASGDLVPLTEDFSLARSIFPVLVAFDTTLNGPGHAEFLAREFTRALEPDELLHSGYMRKGRLTVAPLVLMTIEDLEDLESSVENFRLLDLLREYTHAVLNGARPSLHDFMVASQKRYRFIHSKELADRSIKALEHMARALFPARL